MRTRIGRTEDVDIISIKDSDRTRHVLVCGGTGKGKSVCLTNIIKQDIPFHSIIVLDPSEFLAHDAWSMKQDIYVSKSYCPIALNPMLAGDKYQTIDLVTEYINHCIGVTTGYTEKLSPNMRNILGEDIEWCLDNNRPRLDAVRDRLKLRKVAPNHALARDGIISRFDNLFQDPSVHRLLCTEKPFDFEKFSKEKRMLVLNTSGWGQDKNVYGGSALTYLLLAYFRNQRREKYHPISLVVDECHHYVNSTFYDILKEGRKYALMATLATQDFANIPKDFTHTVLSNVGTIISLSPGAYESKLIAQECNAQWEAVKFTEKHHGFVRTPQFTGVIKMDRPPIITKKPLPVHTVEKRRMWFVTA